MWETPLLELNDVGPPVPHEMRRAALPQTVERSIARTGHEENKRKTSRALPVLARRYEEMDGYPKH